MVAKVYERLGNRNATGGKTACRCCAAPWNPRSLGDVLNSHTNQAILAIMKKASITEAKNNLSSLIDGLKGGSPVLIVDRGRPVARLEPVTNTLRADDEGRLGRLVRDGIVRPARAAASRAVFTTKPPRLKGGVSGVRALLEERREGR